MNWVIDKSKKMPYHTYLEQLLKPLDEYLDSYNWLLCDIEGGGDLSNLPIDYEQEYFVLSPQEFRTILDNYFQFWWGAILGIPNL